jgi:hypothetical protein
LDDARAAAPATSPAPAQEPSQAPAAKPDAAPPAAAAQAAQPKSDALNTLALSPAVIMTHGLPGQSATQALTISNNTSTPFSFEMVAKDVAVRDGHRVFVEAGELAHGIAATAIFSPKHVVVEPHHSVSVNVTVTLTPNAEVRAIAAIFQAETKVSSGSVGMMASLGTLITFTASNDFAVTPSELAVKPQTETQPLKVALELTNTGTEPVIPEGVVALLSENGKLVGKMPFDLQRLLPGERLEFAAEYSAQLRAGRYRAVASFQFEDKSLSKTTEFTVE